MRKTLHNTLRAALLAVGITAFAAPAVASVPMPFAAEAIAAGDIEIAVTNGSNLRVKNADGCIIEVYSITGEKKMTQRVESPSASFDLSHLPKGIYIVKVGKTAMKIYLR